MSLSAHIRGIYASASLKQDKPQTALTVGRYIRGIYASASLKPERVIELHTDLWTYPRHLRLGLIEALPTAYCTFAAHNISEAFTPRPH